MFIHNAKLFMAILGIILFWSLATPLFEFPDEQAHVGTVNFFVQEGRAPEGPELDMTQEMQKTQQYLGVYRNHLGHNSFTYHPEYRLDYSDTFSGPHESAIVALNTSEQRSQYVGEEAARYPKLYYYYLSGWQRLVNNSDIFVRTYVMRLGNILLAVLTSFVIYRIGLALFARQGHALVLTLLVMFQPMYSFVSAGINSDNLHNLLFACVIYLGLGIVHSGLTLRLGVLSLLVVFLDIFTKPQGLLAIPVLILALLVHIFAHKQWRALTGVFLMGLAGIAVLIGPGNRYKGWLLSSNIHSASVVEYLRFSLNQLVAQNIVWYWGVFKWLGVVLPPLYWQIANRIVLLATLGLLLYLYKIIRGYKVSTAWSNTLFLLLSASFYAIAIYYFDYQYVKSVGYSIGIQARYLFPTISAHLALLMIGLLSLTSNSKIQAWILRGLVIFIIWLQLGGLWQLLSSYYDLSSLSMFVTQVSQYKPFFAKGEWWYLWLGSYLFSLSYLLYLGLRQHSKTTRI